MTLRRVTLLLVLLALVACDGTPSDPLSERADLIALAGVDPGHGRQPAPLSLQGLLFSAVHKVYTEQGAGAARSLVGELRRLQEDARAAQSSREREAATARLLELHAEELGIVLRVFGPGIAERTAAAVRVDAEGLRSAVAASEQAGRELPRASILLDRLAEALAEARAAATDGDVLASLDAATRAAAMADGVRVALAEARRIPTLEDLFAASVDVLRSRQDGEDVQQDLARFDALQRDADAAVGSRDRERVHTALRAVRDEQVAVVLGVLGPPAVTRMLDAFGYSVADAETALALARRAGRDVSRLERMVASARDLRSRAASALAAGDAATALDLGSHAVGLLNSVRLALTGS